MKRKTVVLLIRILLTIIGIQMLLLYIAYLTQANKNIKFKYEDVNCTEANATTIELTAPSAKSESTTTEMSSTSLATNTTTIADMTTLVNDITKISTDITIVTAASETITEGSTTILPTTMTTKTTTPQPPFPPPISTNPTSTTPPISSTTKMTSTNASETTNTSTTTNCTTKSTTSSESYMTSEDITSAETNKTHCRTTDPKFNYVIWNNKTENKTACILSNMTIHINIHYKIEDSQKNKITLTVPTNATTTGICSERENEITLSWRENFKNQNDEDKKNKITFAYTYNDTDNKSFLNFVSVDIYNFPYAREREIHEDTQHRYLELFPTVKEGAFTCKVNTTINVGKQIDVVISDVRLITFNECDEDCSKTEIDCAVRTIDNIKMIIVILFVDIFLIFIILYLTWRYRRSNFARFKNSVNIIYRK